jgi:hypothetical protein
LEYFSDGKDYAEGFTLDRLVMQDASAARRGFVKGRRGLYGAGEKHSPATALRN